MNRFKRILYSLLNLSESCVKFFARVGFSAIVINWNSGQRLQQLLDSLDVPFDSLRHLVVVDNDLSTAPEILFSQLERVLYLPQERNLGFAGGLNLGIESTDAEFLLVLNPDTRVTSEAIRGLLQEIEKNPQAAIVCPRLVNLDGKGQESFQIRSLPTLRSVVSDALFFDELASRMNRKSGDQSDSRHSSGEIEQPAAACWMLRRSAWQEVGGFDTRFHPAWFEDVDFCLRLQQAGWKILYRPQWEVLHEGGYSVEHLGYPRFLRLYYGNLLRFWKKHHAGTFPIVWVAVRLGLAIRLLMTRGHATNRT